jgi:hypothetical protein
MKVTLFFNDIDYDSEQANIIREWIAGLVLDKTTDNTSPLRYADDVKIDRD